MKLLTLTLAALVLPAGLAVAAIQNHEEIILAQYGDEGLGASANTPPETEGGGRVEFSEDAQGSSMTRYDSSGERTGVVVSETDKSGNKTLEAATPSGASATQNLDASGNVTGMSITTPQGQTLNLTPQQVQQLEQMNQQQQNK